MHTICESLAEEPGKPADDCKQMIKFVQDRPGYGLRYAVDSSRIN